MIADDIGTAESTIVTFLLDRTGSMEQVRDDTIGAFNTYLHTLKREGKGIDFSLLLFDSMSIDKVHLHVPVREAHPLTRDSFVPRANTPLIDAAWKTIKAVETYLATRTDKPKVVICIQTDGQENASREHTFKELSALIAEKTLIGWQFNFMGVGIDAYNQGAQMGISANSTVSYSADPEATREAFLASASNTAKFSAGTRRDTSYTTRQKTLSGDPTAGGVSGYDPAKPTKIVEDFTL